jgi:DNA-binding PadR family transcriptional regulator
VIESYWGNENAGARRRYYRLTDEGRRLYEENVADWRRYRAMISALFGIKEDMRDE